MESNLDILEFRTTLKNVTKLGNPKIKLSPFFSIFTVFGESSKTFFGVFDDKSFYLTSNFGFFQKNATLYTLKGNYKPYNGKLKVEYIVEPRYKYQKTWWILVTLFGFIFFNYVLFENKNSIEPDLFYIINSFLILMVCFGVWNIWRSKKRLEKNFITIFDITN